MGIKKFKPVTSTLRGTILSDHSELTRETPHKPLTRGKRSTGGRNNRGKVTAYWRGGGHKRKLRVVDFKRDKFGVPGIVESVEYDPNRSANIALIKYADGERRYIVQPKGMTVGETIVSGPAADIKVGNALPLEKMPVGTIVHCVEMRPGKGAQLGRSAGASIQFIARDKGMATLRLQSGEIRLVPASCMATVGQVGNEERENLAIGKAGRNRWLGWRSHNRGVAMNPVDHPMGGGEGKTSGGGHPVSRTGVPSKGYKTRKKSKTSNKFIVKRRK